MIKYLLTSIFLITSTITTLSNVTGDSIRFIGNAPQYAGFHLVFYRYSNFISSETTPVISLTIDKNGSFDCTFPNRDIFCAYADLGRFKAYLYVEPGMSYNLVLPPFEPKSETEMLNPLFRPEEIPIGIANKESRDLTRNIVAFNEDFESKYNTNALSLFVSGNRELSSKIEKELEEKYTFDHSYFNAHKHFLYLKLWHTTLRNQERNLIYKYLSSHPIEFNLPVYWDEYKTLLSGFLPDKYCGTHNLAPLFKPDSPFDSITNILTSDTLFTNKLFAETALLFTLYESFYKKTIPEETVLTITQSAVERASNPETRQMARELFQKMSKLRPGTIAPLFTLNDSKGNVKTNDDYSGKFIYLSFVHTKNYDCLRDLQTIERFHKIFKKELSIVTIVLDENYDAMEEFLNKNDQYNWDFLHYGTSPNVLFNYNIKAVPSYFLINPSGKLVLSPAPTPDENFRQLFTEIYRQYQRSEIRKNPVKEKSIFR